ncbi:MAG: HEAT repeat domain-containing protein [Desulfobulbaceae bacterium]|jgi:hypothetical protein|nr:HEAT repeat domain-containing protein [Desulfobulbaceae bacterium]
MASRRIKHEALAILAAYPADEADRRLASRWREEELIHPLFSALCNVDELGRFRAIDVFGRVLARLSARDMEAARVVMRRLLWSLNDESGGIGWGAPEAMASAIALSRPLADEYLHMLISYLKEDGEEPCQDGNFLELPFLQRGLLWGIGHVAASLKERLLAMGVAEEMAKYLRSPDQTVVGLALWCLSRLGVATALPIMPVDESAVLRLYENGALHSLSLAELARRVVSTPPLPPATR